MRYRWMRQFLSFSGLRVGALKIARLEDDVLTALKKGDMSCRGRELVCFDHWYLNHGDVCDALFYHRGLSDLDWGSHR